MKMLSIITLIFTLGLLSSGIAQAHPRGGGNHANRGHLDRHNMPRRYRHEHHYSDYRYVTHQRYSDRYRRHYEHGRHGELHGHHRSQPRRMIREVRYLSGLLRNETSPRNHESRHEHHEQRIINSRLYR